MADACTPSYCTVTALFVAMSRVVSPWPSCKGIQQIVALGLFDQTDRPPPPTRFAFELLDDVGDEVELCVHDSLRKEGHEATGHSHHDAQGDRKPPPNQPSLSFRPLFPSSVAVRRVLFMRVPHLFSNRGTKHTREV